MSEDKKRKKKAYYGQIKKSKNEYEIGVGMRGFLITCNNNEAKTVVEAYKVLNDYADKLYGSSQTHDKEENDNISGEEDIEAELKKHVEGFKKQPVKERRFQNVTTKVKSVVFIKTTLAEPLKLVEEIFEDTLQSGLARSRFILRLVPVLDSCKADEEKLGHLCEKHFEKYLNDYGWGEEVTYSTLYKIRCNNVLNREMIYACVNKAFKTLRPLARVDYDNPDIVFNVNVLPKVCCLSILRNYNKYKKYNLNELLSTPPPTTEATNQPTNTDSTGCGESKSYEGDADKDGKLLEVNVANTIDHINESTDEIKSYDVNEDIKSADITEMSKTDQKELIPLYSA